MNTKSELGEFIMAQSDSYNTIAKAINKYAYGHKNEIPCIGGGYFDPEQTEVYFKFAHNVVIHGDEITFDAGIEASFVVSGNKRNDYEDLGGSEWFLLKCQMRVTDRLDGFKIKSVEVFTGSQKLKLPNAATHNFVPVISREEYETEATAFLEAWCPEALTTVMQVPIKDIVERRMGLTVFDDTQLSRDLQVFGLICFKDSTIKTYDTGSDSFVDRAVKRGDVFIDPQVVYLRCLGCGHNTLAHEAFHWWRHRVYATVRGILRNEGQLIYRCPTTPKRIRRKAQTNEDWMEIQANAIAPKILMPRAQTESKIKQLIKQYGWDSSECDFEILQTIIDELALFYSVSKQAAKIRMIELGYPEAMEVYNYDSDCNYLSHEITELDAYQEAATNDDFKALLEMGLFRYAEGYFVINTDKYTVQGDDGEYRLTDFARENLADCALNFQYNALDLITEYNRANGVLYKPSRQPRAVQVYTPEYNEKLIDTALLEVSRAQAMFEAAQEFCPETAAQMLMRLMDSKKWNTTIFQQKTGLNAKQYSNTKNKPNRKFDLHIVVSICVGLDLPHGVSIDILRLAGYTLNPAVLEHSLYNHILMSATMRNIYACNEFLKAAAEKYKQKVTLLGSGDYDGEGQAGDI